MERLCMYTPSARGGHALYTAELLRALVNNPRGGDRFELVTSEDIESEFRAVPYPVNAMLPTLAHRSQYRTVVSWAVDRALHYSRRDAAFLRWLESRPDIRGVHLQEYFPWRPSPLFRGIRQLDRKVFYTVHNIKQHVYPPILRSKTWDNLSRKAWRLADCLFVLTQELADQLATFLGPGHPPIHVTPHGVWTVPDSVTIPSLSERLSWRKLLFFGTLRRNKGIDLLLDAAKSLKQFKLTIAGEPVDRDYFNQELNPKIQAMRGNGFDITLIDRFTTDAEAAQLFSTHSAIVLPYTQQFVAQSGVAFLSLAHEIPMIASEVGGLRDLFKQFRLGQSFSEATPAGLSGAIDQLFNGNHRDQLLSQIRQAKQHFSWDNSATITLAAYAKYMDPAK